MVALPNFLPHVFSIYREELPKVEDNAFRAVFKHFKNEILGFGSHGTIVYKGEFQRRPIAIKQVPKKLSKTVDREISIMLQIDQHPNILRYFGKEEDEHYLYIGTELCECTLKQLMTDKGFEQKLKTKEILQQTVEGLNHLHQLAISNYY